MYKYLGQGLHLVACELLQHQYIIIPYLLIGHSKIFK